MSINDRVERLLDGLEPPTPPPELERRVVMRAAAALAEPVETDPWRRVWQSRPLRLAWATAVLALVVGHLAVTIKGNTPRPASSWAEARAEQWRAVGELPRISPRAITWEPVAGGSGHTRVPLVARSPEKETRQ